MANNGDVQAQQPENPPQGRSMISTILQFMLFSWVLRSFFGSSQQPKSETKVGEDGEIIHTVHQNVWDNGESFDFRAYLSEFEALTDNPETSTTTEFVWEESNLFYNWDPLNERERNLTFDCPTRLHSNGSMWLHIYFYRAGMSPIPNTNSYDEDTLAISLSIVQFRRKTIAKKFVNLIDTTFSENIEAESEEILSRPEIEEVQDNDDDREQQWDDNFDESEDASKWLRDQLDGRIIVDSESTVKDTRPIVGYWPSTLTLRLVVDFTVYSRGGIPVQILPHIKLVPEHEELYFPILYHDTFWLLRETYTELNDTVESLSLTLQYSPITMWKWQLQTQMETSFAQQQSWGGAAEGDSDEMRRMFLESNPYLLGFTFAVSILHMVFDFLAFKNDITFWKNTKDLTGLSVRTIFLNCFCSVVIFFYLLENETSWMILMSSGVGIGIEFWKIRKAAKVTGGISGGLFGILPWIKIEDSESYAKSETSKHDKQAMKYLSYVLYPLVICYAIYSLIYEQHKGWYQWVLASLVGSVYTFGFVMMCPQLYLNYKLQSVAHLPWRMMTYKALNTVIDDLFAFVIKMPTMHRISCFRDDIVFAIFLYQKWIYRVDYSRTNEYGYNPAQHAAAKAAKDSKNSRATISLGDESTSQIEEVSDVNPDKEPADQDKRQSESISGEGSLSNSEEDKSSPTVSSSRQVLRKRKKNRRKA